jgi:putative transposase
MSEKYKMHDKEGIYFVTLTAVDWVDLFTRRELKLIIVDSIKYCQLHKGLIVYAWCLMHSHLHMIISAKPGNDPSAILRDMKKFTANEIIKKINDEPESRREWILHRFEFNSLFKKRIKKYKVWQDGNRPKQIITSAFMKQKLAYIHNNPVEEMIVEEPHQYVFSSARDYAGANKGGTGF